MKRMTKMDFNFFNPTRILFGVGMLNQLHLQALPGKKTLLLISNGKSTRLNGSLDSTMEELKKAGVEYVLFHKIMENPYKSVIAEGVAFLANPCEMTDEDCAAIFNQSYC